MRLGRGPFWRLFAINLLIAAVVWLLLPTGFSMPWPGLEGTPLPPIPLKPIIIYLICIPATWLGARRLHDVGRAGWHAWLPLMAFACATFMPSLLQPLLLKLVIEAQANPLGAREVAAKIMIGLWLVALLVGAGSLRTVFLWLEPGDPQENRYGPVPANAPVTAPSKQSAPTFVLGGRIRRLPFWLVLAGNVAFVKGATYVLTHWPEMAPPDAQTLSQLHFFFYLPSFYVATLRLHDRNQSGLLSLVALMLNAAAAFAESLLPQGNLVNAGVDIVTIYLLFQCLQPGDTDENRYGPPPGHEPQRGGPEAARGSSQRAISTVQQTSARSTAARPVVRQGFGRRVL